MPTSHLYHCSGSTFVILSLSQTEKRVRLQYFADSNDLNNISISIAQLFNTFKSTAIRLIHLYWYYQHPTMTEPYLLWHCLKQAWTRTTNWVTSTPLMSHSCGQVVSRTGLRSKELHSCHWRSFFSREPPYWNLLGVRAIKEILPIWQKQVITHCPKTE